MREVEGGNRRGGPLSGTLKMGYLYDELTPGKEGELEGGGHYQRKKKLVFMGDIAVRVPSNDKRERCTTKCPEIDKSCFVRLNISRGGENASGKPPGKSG